MSKRVGLWIEVASWAVVFGLVIWGVVERFGVP
jgi:hypothetical protein